LIWLFDSAAYNTRRLLYFTKNAQQNFTSVNVIWNWYL